MASRTDNPAENRKSASVDLVDASEGLGSVDRQWLCGHAERILAELNLSGELRVRVVRDPEMGAAHQKFKAIAGTTDVLTFDLGAGDAELDIDILICLDEAARQCQARGHELRRELLLYIVHGLLHCIGHDDSDPEAAARMHEAEDRLLESVGVGVVYARPVADARKDTA
jgi:probable rRNA maturation factor